MKTAIVYYTFGGSTKREAERLAGMMGADVFRVFEAKKRSFFSAFIPGGHTAMKRKEVAIKPIDVDLNAYDRIVLGAPVWAGFPAPAFNSIVKLLPKGKEVEIFLCSGGGGTEKSAEGTKAMIKEKGCTVVSYRDVMTGAKPGKLKD